MSSVIPSRFGRLALACTLLTGLAAGAQASTLDKVKDSSSVRIGYANETPFAYTALDGSVTGESPEIVKKIFERMGVEKINPVLTEWGSLIPGLRASRFDLIAAGMYITPERCKQVLFTDPHYQLPDTLLVKTGNPKGLHSYEDIAKSGAKVAIMSGTVNLGYARSAGITNDQILQVPDTTAQLQAVRAGRADAAVGTQLTMKGLADKGGDSVEAIAEFKDDPAHTGYGALAFRPEDKELRDAVNAELKQWLGSEEHLATVGPFGFDQSNITDKTAAELCGQ
ncbi:ectoine/hydroxyectoine ABC transporter substrate-binding protein EhuB [Pseudomonas chengduensis]|uniref:Amino acid ABC transporter substrate-binding protein, PAAT family n=2 Tax=Pseudomonadaceae TaxID=135621 RepID=A0A1H2MSZ3_9PSED|nr:MULTISPECIES: ectoine/hydroxyectoine ABC transporter substrate-binding protein EhuB [Pseudomonas]KQO33652.1 ectoine/hydroxyectoine ABC transporter substrate-binding protein EhuB [Pseudomonas sp. Leaf83]MBP3059779.1 ectoine/hydroxyectoine ABC transporter substrate-binding protein EhuB [Pseudomonas chengduensis]MDH0956359.1 ectoine/hydroxyectoine ABC transporter substrate-binding protein EhuB [Pseudomonas chengduensis]MDH1534356.1 ectoine/hydroxyectoine ABC transporter substrate-binding protei